MNINFVSLFITFLEDGGSQVLRNFGIPNCHDMVSSPTNVNPEEFHSSPYTYDTSRNELIQNWV
jgi:hypothetical protein